VEGLINSNNRFYNKTIMFFRLQEGYLLVYLFPDGCISINEINDVLNQVSRNLVNFELNESLLNKIKTVTSIS